MKLNWAERWTVNNPIRVLQQRFETRWMNHAHALSPGSVILEVGCGRGAGAGIILHKFQPALFHALDLDIEMIRMARNHLPAGGGKRVNFYVADVFRLPYRDETFDAVFGFGVLHHVPDWGGALMEIARVLKPGGVYFMEEIYPSLYANFITRHILLHPRDDRFRSPELRRALQASELSPVRVLEFGKLGILCVATKGAEG